MTEVNGSVAFRLGMEQARFQLSLSRVVLAVCLNISSFFDYYSTKRALEIGLKEGNPIAKAIMKMGWRKYQLTKFALPVVWAYMGVTSEDPNEMWKVSMALGTLAFIYVTINNLLIMRRLG